MIVYLFYTEGVQFWSTLVKECLDRRHDGIRLAELREALGVGNCCPILEDCILLNHAFKNEADKQVHWFGQDWDQNGELAEISDQNLNKFLILN